MTNRRDLDWFVPSDEWDRFLRYVESEYGETDGNVSREVERAIREWLDSDEFASVEEKVDRLVQAAGRTPSNLGEKKQTVDHPGGEETERVYAYVAEDLKEAFAVDARNAGEQPGTYLARALRARRNGGRSRRVEKKLGRILDDAEALLSEVDPDGDGMPLRERRTVAICQRLGRQFTRDELDEAIAAVAGDSDPTLRTYREKVLDRLDNTTHPANADLFIPEDEARAIASGTDRPSPDAPAIDRKDYADLSRSEKGRGLRIALAREATRNDGRYRFDAEEIRRDVFDGQPSEGHARDLMDLAADAEGFEATRRHGKVWLQVDLRDVTDEEVLSEVRRVSSETDADSPDDGEPGETEGGGPGETDANPGLDADEPGDAAARLAALDAATRETAERIRTDGGEP